MKALHQSLTHTTGFWCTDSHRANWDSLDRDAVWSTAIGIAINLAESEIVVIWWLHIGEGAIGALIAAMSAKLIAPMRAREGDWEGLFLSVVAAEKHFLVNTLWGYTLTVIIRGAQWLQEVTVYNPASCGIKTCLVNRAVKPDKTLQIRLWSSDMGGEGELAETLWKLGNWFNLEKLIMDGGQPWQYSMLERCPEITSTRLWTNLDNIYAMTKTGLDL